jgi:glycine/D-amino acid oxidase-like deaminating enzyme
MAGYYQVQCDLDMTTTFDVCMSQEFLDYAKTSFEAYKRAGGDVSHVTYLEGDAAKKARGGSDMFHLTVRLTLLGFQATRIAGALAAYEWPAASTHPAKLCQHILAECVDLGMRLFTHTPCISVTSGGTPSGEWLVNTARGTIVASKVVHATNAYAATLLPQLEGFVNPFRAQAHALVPMPAFCGPSLLKHTYSLRYTLHHFYSVSGAVTGRYLKWG